MTHIEISPVDDVNKCKYNVPKLPEEFLEIEFLDDDAEEIVEIEQSCPFAINDVTTENIIAAKKLTDGHNVKEVYSLEISSKFMSFKPGDTIGIVTESRQEDINKLFTHLGIKGLAESKIRVLKKSTGKKVQLDLTYTNKVTTLKAIFKSCVDIYCLPRKLLIRVLAHYTTDEKEKSEMEKLCSTEGSDLYTKVIVEANKTFLDFILMFKTCCPPVTRLLENLPKLFPRPYSIASSPLASPDKIKIVFSVIEKKNSVMKEGLCTGMLKAIINNKFEKELQVKMFFRKSNGFHLPESNVPIILVGPGTGVAPFMGFLEHRKLQKKAGPIWLFFGCRYKTKDYLFENELKEYLNSGVLTRLIVAHSKEDDGCAKYVQDNLKKYGKEICDLIFNESAIVYVCGDAKNMRKDVQNSFVEIFEHHQGLTNNEANTILKQLQKEKRYLQDIWL